MTPFEMAMTVPVAPLVAWVTVWPTETPMMVSAPSVKSGLKSDEKSAVATVSWRMV